MKHYSIMVSMEIFQGDLIDYMDIYLNIHIYVFTYMREIRIVFFI